MTNKTATLIGATGLIGSQLLDLLQQDPTFDTIRLLVRRPVPFSHPKVQVVQVDFTNEAAFRAGVAGSAAVFCTVGTTQNKVKGDLVAYRKVDFDIPVHAAQHSAATGCPCFLLVSSVGADSKSNNFYLQIKGEVEDAVQALGIPSVGIFRPSMLLGPRTEFRLGEKIGQVLMQALAFLIPSKYKPIQARTVAAAMLKAAHVAKPGCTVYHYREMRL